MPDAKWYANWVRMLPAESAPEKMRNLEAADLIESHSAELERVKRERDAVVKQLLEIDKNHPFACSYCKHDEVCDGRLVVCGNCGMTSCPCNTCTNHSNWQWRGAKE